MRWRRPTILNTPAARLATPYAAQIVAAACSALWNHYALPHAIPPIPIVPHVGVRPRVVRAVARPAGGDVRAVAAVAVGAAGVVLAAQDRCAQRKPDDAGGEGVAVVVAVAIAAVVIAAPFALALGFPALLIDPGAVVVVAAGTVVAGAAVGIGLGRRRGGRDRGAGEEPAVRKAVIGMVRMRVRMVRLLRSNPEGKRRGWGFAPPLPNVRHPGRSDSGEPGPSRSAAAAGSRIGALRACPG